MFCIAVFDTVEKNRAKVKEALVDYSSQYDTEVDVLWVSEIVPAQYIENYIDKFQIALISLDSNWSLKLGRVIYQKSPSCLICYYSSARKDVIPLLKSRPIAFYLWQQNVCELKSIIRDMVLDWIRQNGVFRFTTRRKQYFVPVKAILYFESDLKYTIIHYSNGEIDRIFGKLSEIYQSLADNHIESGFIKAHKSYIVNKQHITNIDKSTKSLRLSNGVAVPISNSQYQSVLLGMVQSSNTAVLSINTTD